MPMLVTMSLDPFFLKPTGIHGRKILVDDILLTLHAIDEIDLSPFSFGLE